MPADLDGSFLGGKFNIRRADFGKATRHEFADVVGVAINAVGVEIEMEHPRGTAVVKMRWVVIQAKAGIPLVVTEFGEASIPDAPEEDVTICSVWLDDAIGLEVFCDVGGDLLPQGLEHCETNRTERFTGVLFHRIRIAT